MDAVQVCPETLFVPKPGPKPLCTLPGCLVPLTQNHTGRPPKFCCEAHKKRFYRKPDADEKLARQNTMVERNNRDKTLGGFGRDGGYTPTFTADPRDGRKVSIVPTRLCDIRVPDPKWKK